MVQYFTKNGAINPKLVTEEAQKVARSFFPESQKMLLKASQLRKFYGDVKTLELRWKSSTDKNMAFAEILPLIKLLKAKSAYACKRKVVPDVFEKWLCENVEKINSHREFEAFLLHFEAVVGFCYSFAPKDFN